MILTCQKCKTSFELDDSLLNPSGSKVRCSQCEHIFTAYPDRDSIDPEIFEEIFEETKPSVPPNEEPVQEIFEKQESPSKNAPEPKDRQEDEQEIDELPDFSQYEKVLDQPIQPKPDLPSGQKESGTIPPKKESPVPAPQKEHGQGSTKESLSQGFIPPPQPPQIRARPSHKIKKKKNRTKLPAILLVVVFLATAGAYAASLFLGYKIPWLSQSKLPIIDKLIAQEDAVSTDPIPSVDQADLSSKFISNENDGELFVITGIVRNPPNMAYHHIQVKGTLLTKDQKRVSTKRSFCGNIVSDEILKTGYLSKINSLLSNKLGMNGNNSNLAPGALVPFMLVFPELSEEMANFSVEVEGFEKVAPK